MDVGQRIHNCGYFVHIFVVFIDVWEYFLMEIRTRTIPGIGKNGNKQIECISIIRCFCLIQILVDIMVKVCKQKCILWGGTFCFLHTHTHTNTSFILIRNSYWILCHIANPTLSTYCANIIFHSFIPVS